ncbi:MAG: DUF2076 family protein [Betaproteobacteria bacterium]
MTPSELADLNLLLEQLIRARGVRKNPDADALIQRALDLQPDAGYLLVQRVLILEQALDQARARLQDSQAQKTNPPATPPDMDSSVGALARGLNARDGATPSATAFGRTAEAAPPPAVDPSRGYAQPQGRSSWLGNIASTAAGVAAGAFLFQGVESLLGHHGGLGGSDAHPAQALNDNNFGHEQRFSDSTQAADDDLGQDSLDEDLAVPDDDSLDTDFGSDSDFA